MSDYALYLDLLKQELPQLIKRDDSAFAAYDECIRTINGFLITYNSNHSSRIYLDEILAHYEETNKYFQDMLDLFANITMHIKYACIVECRSEKELISTFEMWFKRTSGLKEDFANSYNLYQELKEKRG
jgi:hypothetical protein